MPRLTRVVAPGLPHHITQRGNRRQKTFFNDGDYSAYLDLMAAWCKREAVEIWAYCLMPNHVHLIAVPTTATGLSRVVGETHRRHARRVNVREDWSGHLWQGRFTSFPMDEAHLLAAVRYVELNPIRAGLVRHPEKWRWSSARAHLEGVDDRLARVAPMLELIDDWADYLSEDETEERLAALRGHGRTGRPLGSADFVAALERTLARPLRREKPGPKPGSKRKKSATKRVIIK